MTKYLKTKNFYIYRNAVILNKISKYFEETLAEKFYPFNTAINIPASLFLFRRVLNQKLNILISYSHYLSNFIHLKCNKKNLPFSL